MIEDKRRTTATDFDGNSSKHALDRHKTSPFGTGAMLGDDDLDKLCDDVLTDLDRPPAETSGD